MSSNQHNEQKGIHIEDALSILTLRAKAGREKELVGKKQTNKQDMGQIINLFQSEGDNDSNNATNWTNMSESCDCTNKFDQNAEDDVSSKLRESEEDKQKREKMEKDRLEREQRIRKELEGMIIKDLLSAVLSVQKERVQTYKEFDEGLDKVLQTGNISTYPATCAKATASFSVQSNSINTMNEILLAKNRKMYHKQILKLQAFEKQKLNITAALHLEQIRKQDHCLGLENNPNDADNHKMNGEDRILRLMNEGIISLKQQVSQCIENINDLLDELRCNIIDEEDE